MPAHLLCGDNFLVFQALKEFREKVGPPDLLDANSHRISGAQADLGQLKAVCNAVPFLADYRLVVVDGLLGLFESRPRRRRSSSSVGRGGPAGQARATPSLWKELPKYIGGEMAPTTELVFQEEGVSSANPLFKMLRPALKVREFATPTGEGIGRWIRNRVAEKGARIAPGGIVLLTQLVGGSLWTMDNELEKLALYAGDRQIKEVDVRALVSGAREANIFAAVDALLEGRTAVALRLVHRLREDGAELHYIIAMTARQLRLTTIARDLIDRGHKVREIGERLGLTREFVLNKTLEQARKHSWHTLEGLYGRLIEADLAVKQGRMDQDVALEILAGQPTSPAARERPPVCRSQASGQRLQRGAGGSSPNQS